ncbi:TonB-dependent receptor [Gammaproteobacteria bacterium]|jgi:outer membrane receptor protein involved in Fe transport|nr:TonB-dependent receptor [Gammaproteobacteria bacterium]
MNNFFRYTQVALGVCLLPGLVMAQEQALDEITVTATKREESALDIPISLSAISGQRLDEYNITDLNDLGSVVPNFSTGYQISTTNVTIRGLGSGNERSFEQAVTMFIDGQYMPRSRQYAASFTDVERIEVLRGPQSVLQGLNATAGAVSLITRRNNPGDAFEADLSADYETEFGGTGLSLGVGGSVSDSVGLRLALRYEDRDGYFENTFTGQDEEDSESLVGRLTAVIATSDASSLTLKYERSDNTLNGNFGEAYGLFASALEPDDGELNWKRSADAALIDPWDVNFRSSPGWDVVSDNYLATYEHEFSGSTLTAVAGYSTFEMDMALDFDEVALSILDGSLREEYDQTSLEVRLASTGDRTFDYIFGVYYHDAENFQEQPSQFGSDALGGTPILLDASSLNTLDSELWSVFGQFDWNIGDNLSLYVGARFSSEDKDLVRADECQVVTLDDTLGLPPGTSLDPAALSLDILCTGTNLPAGGVTPGRSSENFMPEAGLQFSLSDNSMLYGKVTGSAKSGGFAFAGNVRLQDIEYDDESVVSVEAGWKSRFADGTAELNIAVFRSEFDDLQVNSFVFEDVGGVQTTVPVVRNAAKAISQGVELDGRWAAADWLTIGAAVAFLDAEFDEFSEAPCNTTNNPGTGVCDLTGSPLPFAADTSGNVYADLDIPVGSALRIVGGVDVGFSDAFFTEGTLEPDAEQSSWTRVSARLGIAGADNRWSIMAIGRNLTDETVLTGTQPLGQWLGGYIDPPRTLSIQGTLRFGD